MAIPVKIRVVAEYRFFVIDACVIKTGRNSGTKVGKIFRTGAAFHGNQLDTVSHVVAQDGFDAGCDGIIVYAYWGEGNDMKLAGTTINGFRSGQDMLQCFQYILTFFFIICAQRSLEFCCIGNDVGIMAGLELAKGEDDAVAIGPFMVYIVLNLGDNGYAHLNGADAIRWPRSVSAFSMDCDGEIVTRSRTFSMAKTDVSLGSPPATCSPRA